ncbi:glycosyltransferase [candidate division TA06 bacterium]|nr:glycosyltransferase [candidate division TA06 bacterium]
MFNEIARQLADSNGQVVCFNRPIFMLTDLFGNIKRWRKVFESEPQKHGNNLSVNRPKLYIHPLIARHIPFAQKIQKSIYRSQVEKLLKNRGFLPDNTVLWLSHPYQLMEMDLPANYKVVYERYDKYEKAVGLSPDLAGLVFTLDHALVKRADLIITTASKLAEELNGAKEKTHNLPNSADYEYFSGVGAAEDLRANLTKGIIKPVIGYLGTIHEGLDAELLLKLAELKKEWTFLLVGPVQSRKMAETPIFNELKGMPNVILTGWLDWAVLPGYLKLFDVGIIPYRLDCEFNKYVDPNKFHEYMAMGLPIVSTSLPEMSKYEEWVEMADNTEAFAGSIEKVLKDNDESKKCKRKNYARENSWVQRASKIIPLMDKIV